MLGELLWRHLECFSITLYWMLTIEVNLVSGWLGLTKNEAQTFSLKRNQIDKVPVIYNYDMKYSIESHVAFNWVYWDKYTALPLDENREKSWQGL